MKPEHSQKPRFQPWRSFRLRMVLLASTLSAALLVGFGMYALEVITRISVQRMDADLLEAARRNLVGPASPRYWEDVQRDLSLLYGEDRVTLCAIGRGGYLIFQSENWPQELDPNQFPDPDEMEPPPFEPGRREGPPRRGPMAGRRPPEAMGAFRLDRGGEVWRFIVTGVPHTTLILGADEGRFRDDVRRMRTALLLALPLGILLAAAGSLYFTQRALRPVRALADLTERMTARGLNERIELRDEDIEFRRLLSVFNGMLERLERSFAQATRFSADAAHELKTPLAVLQGELERGVQESAPGSDEQGRYSRLIEQVTRLKTITRKLLLLATADAGELKLHLVPFNLSEAIESIAEDAAILAPQLTIKSNIAPGIHVLADGDLLRQLVQNLVMNAMKYNHKSGHVELHLREFGEHVQFTVTNTGRGIPEQHRDHVFQRFYRADKARTRAYGGAGLGLSLSREIARAHRGELYLDQTPPGLTAFTLELPNPKLLNVKAAATQTP